jgi:hypothetical protein
MSRKFASPAMPKMASPDIPLYPVRRAQLFTKGFSPQAIETKACTRFSGLDTEIISLLILGSVRRLFLIQPRVSCGDYFSAKPGLVWSVRGSPLIAVMIHDHTSKYTLTTIRKWIPLVNEAKHLLAQVEHGCHSDDL